MDEQTKIRVLMIYYNHWGKDEIRLRKTIDGLNKTISILKNEYASYNDLTLSDALGSLFYQYSDVHISILYKDMIDVLLKDYGGFYDDERNFGDYDEQDDLLFDRKYNFEENTGDLSQEGSSILYNDNFTHHHVLSVESIVALKPIHYYDRNFYYEYSDTEEDIYSETEETENT